MQKTIEDFERYWCEKCGRAYPYHGTGYTMSQSEEFSASQCPICSHQMMALPCISREARASLRLQDWAQNSFREGVMGPSPQVAAKELGCDRTMIDKLVDRGVLEKTVYDHDGQLIIMISRRSLKQAKKNKEQRGKWTDDGEDEN